MPIHRFCLACGREYAFDEDRCPACGEPSLGHDFDGDLLKALAHPIPDVAANAARLLGQRQPAGALEALLRASQSAEPLRAEAALEALASFDDQQAHARIHEALGDSRVRMRAIAQSLSRPKA
ncbi:MAG: HEAT repeat domain-containing protein [Vulcanimicrobiaceae bacterium]